MATFPPRAGSLKEVVERILPQVDQLNVVFNEYLRVPEKYKDVQGLCSIIPHEDTRDVGKFYPEISESGYILFVDDDVDYPEDYVTETIRRFEALPEVRFLGGYHTSIYQKPKVYLTLNQIGRYIHFLLLPHKIAAFRKVVSFLHDLDAPIFVDQVATNSAIMRGRDMPPYTYMRDSQNFVDVRLALWCFGQGIETVALPRKAGWLVTEPDDHSIFLNFTRKNHSRVAKEIWKFAFKKTHVGKSIHKDQSDLSTSNVEGMK